MSIVEVKDMVATKKQCDTCTNVRGLGKKHFSPHVWCNPEKAYFERDHVCNKWSDVEDEDNNC